MTITDRVLLITGGAKGIGAATAKLAAQNNWFIAINFLHSKNEAHSLKSAIIAEGGVAEAIQGDISTLGGVRTLFNQIDKHFGCLYGLVNNASFIPDQKSFLSVAAPEFKKTINVNLFGTFACTQEAVKRMAISKGGCGGVVVNVSSEVARFGGDRVAAYTASKAGINGLTIGLARELAGEGIRINAVSPGVIDTETNRQKNSETLGSKSRSHPMGRMGAVDEVAETIIWLLSDSASYVSGAILPVSGGR